MAMVPMISLAPRQENLFRPGAGAILCATVAAASPCWKTLARPALVQIYRLVEGISVGAADLQAESAASPAFPPTVLAWFHGQRQLSGRNFCGQPPVLDPEAGKM